MKLLLVSREQGMSGLRGSMALGTWAQSRALGTCSAIQVLGIAVDAGQVEMFASAADKR